MPFTGRNTRPIQKENSRSRKSRKEVRDRLEYAVFEEIRATTKTEYQVNNLGTKPENAKYVSATNIWIYDNQMFTDAPTSKISRGIFFLPCPPLYIIFANSGNFKNPMVLWALYPLPIKRILLKALFMPPRNGWASFARCRFSFRSNAFLVKRILPV